MPSSCARVMQKAHLRDAGDAGDDTRMRPLQLMQTVQQPRTDAMQVRADIVTLEHGEGRTRGSERYTLRRQRR